MLCVPSRVRLQKVRREAYDNISEINQIGYLLKKQKREPMNKMINQIIRVN